MKKNVGVPEALATKNEQDFVEVTKRIQEALARIEGDRRLKATQGVLAQLSKCSRGTLNNREWPIQRLKAIKVARQTPPKPIEDESARAVKEASRIERYKQQLYDSREELLVWKTRYDDVKVQLQQAQQLATALQSRVVALEQELAKLAKHKSKVLPFPTKGRR